MRVLEAIGPLNYRFSGLVCVAIISKKRVYAQAGLLDRGAVWTNPGGIRLGYQSIVQASEHHSHDAFWCCAL